MIVRHALRNLVRSWRFGLSLTTVLALGTVTVGLSLSLCYSMLWRPLPYVNPDALFAVWRSDGTDRSMVSPWLVRYLGERLSAVADIAALRSGATTDEYSLQLRTDDLPVRLRVTGVSTNYFDVLGRAPQLGRAFEAIDGWPSAQPVILISDRCWKLTFGGDPGVVGRTIPALDRTGARSYLVIGVMPAGFQMLYTLPTVGRDEDVYIDDAWVPMRLTDDEWANDARVWAQVLLRLHPGQTADSTRARLSAAISAHPTPLTRSSSEQKILMVPLRDDLTRDVSRQLKAGAMIAISLVLFLIATASSMFAARFIRRGRELSILWCLGMSDRAILQMLCVELAALTALAVVVAVALGRVAITLVIGSLPLRTPRTLELFPAPVLITAIVAAGGLVLLVLLIQGAGHLRSAGLSHGGSTGQDTAARHYLRAFRRWLLGTQVASATALLVCALVVTRSAIKLSHVELGFQPRGLFAATLNPVGGLYQDDESRGALGRRIAEALSERFPAGATLTNSPPILGISYRQGFVLDVSHGSLAGSAESVAVGEQYFAVVGQRLLSGRAFAEASDESGGGGAVVNEAWVERYLPAQSPLGVMMMFHGRVWRQIVGVVEDTRSARLRTVPAPTVYVRLQPSDRGPLTILARANDLGTAAIGIRGAVRAAAKDVPLSATSEMRDVADKTATDTFVLSRLLVATSLLSVAWAIFAASALIAAFSHESRRELAVRVALGAPLLNVRLHVVRQIGVPTLAGILAGVMVAAGASRIMKTLLYGVAPLDGASFLVGVVAMALVVFTAAYIPMLRLSESGVIRSLRD